MKINNELLMAAIIIGFILSYMWRDASNEVETVYVATCDVCKSLIKSDTFPPNTECDKCSKIEDHNTNELSSLKGKSANISENDVSIIKIDDYDVKFRKDGFYISGDPLRGSFGCPYCADKEAWAECEACENSGMIWNSPYYWEYDFELHEWRKK